MTCFRTLAVATALAFAAAASFAQQDEQHDAHHPEGAASAPTPAPAANKPTGMSSMSGMAMMDKHMQAMRQMHEKLAAAKTPAEREALMTEHMKLMQEGMSMMGEMSPGKPPATPAMRQQMLEKRMDMMESMMQMMMDRMPMSPPAPGK